jgi:hypothetical protein
MVIKRGNIMAEEHVTENSEIENDEMPDWNSEMIEDMAETGSSPDLNSLVVIPGIGRLRLYTTR